MGDASRGQAIKFDGWLTIDEIGYGATYGGGEGEAVTGKSQREGETVEAGRVADEGDVVDALGFEAAPGTGDALVGEGWQ